MENKIAKVPQAPAPAGGIQRLTTWVRIDKSGEFSAVLAERLQLALKVGLRPRDLRLFDPELRHVSPPCILDRARSIVVNLAALKCIITAEYVLVVEPEQPASQQLIRELRHALSTDTRHTGMAACYDGLSRLSFITHQLRRCREGGDPSSVPTLGLSFELKALEVCLDQAVGELDAEAHELEDAVLPLLDHLLHTALSKSTELEQLRKLKNAISHLSQRMQTTLEVLEQYLNDDADMHALQLTAKAATQRLNTPAGLSPVQTMGHPLATVHEIAETATEASEGPAQDVRVDLAQPSLPHLPPEPSGRDSSSGELPTAHASSHVSSHASQHTPLRTSASMSSWQRGLPDPHVHFALPTAASGHAPALEGPPASQFARHSSPEDWDSLAKLGASTSGGRRAMYAQGTSFQRSSLRSRASLGRSSRRSARSSRSDVSDLRSLQDEVEIAEVEMLLEAYERLLDNSRLKLQTLAQQIEDTEDLVAGALDHQRNRIIVADIFMTALYTILGFGGFVAGVFGMSVAFPFYAGPYDYDTTLLGNFFDNIAVIPASIVPTVLVSLFLALVFQDGILVTNRGKY